MSSKIYTKTGDEGTTSLLGGTKISKAHQRIEAYGTVDELNSYIGLCRDLLQDTESRQSLLDIQDRLFTIGSSLACDPDKEPKMKIPDLRDGDILTLEYEIDRMTTVIPAMKHFVLPGGHVLVSHLHVARCICRRAERAVVRLESEKGEVPAIVVRYLNRLSDFLFILARYAGHLAGVVEIAWKPRLD